LTLLLAARGSSAAKQFQALNEAIKPFRALGFDAHLRFDNERPMARKCVTQRTRAKMILTMDFWRYNMSDQNMK